jgi:MinD-like ATPase involved in chromosome partitioning or flagellar assembly
VIILRPDQQTTRHATVDLARRLEVPDLVLVVNKVLPIFESGAVRDQAEKTFGAPVAGVLPLCDEMVQLASGGIFCRRYPDHPFTKGVQQIARRLLG